MSRWSCNVGLRRHFFESLRELMAKATPHRSGDELAGLAAATAEERVAARNNAVPAPTSKCKVTEVIQVTTGPHGTPIRQVVSTNMDCSSCNDTSMACYAGKAKS